MMWRPPRRWPVAAAAAVLLGAAGAAQAWASEPTKAVSYRGYVIRVPRAWPVYDLRRSPTVCVRFDRHALYLGTPSSDQRCPGRATGRTEAILIEPLKEGMAAAQNSAPTFVLRRQGLLVSATWANEPSLVERALGLRSLRGLHAPRLPHVARRPATARPAQASGGVYTGLGFDACSAPSSSTLSAWGSSAYHAVGVYIGGASGIRDLVAQVGTGYLEPDDLWIADWNGQQTTSDPYVPSSDWSSHQRLHQYQGAHNETHGSVTLNIDGDYLDGATAGG